MSVFFIDSSKRAPLLPHCINGVASQPRRLLSSIGLVSRRDSGADTIGYQPARLPILPSGLRPINRKSQMGFSLSESGALMTGAGQFWYAPAALMTIMFRRSRGLVPPLLRRTIIII